VRTTDSRRDAKFRQAAFVYLHVAILYEGIVWVLHGAGRLPAARGPIFLWMVLGGAIAGFVFWGLWFRRSAWIARVIWLLGSFRLPWLIKGAFLPGAGAALPAEFYQLAFVAVSLNLWMLARAGWDL